MNKKIPSKYLILIFFLVLICIVLPMLILNMPAKAETADKNDDSKVVAPALQYLREDYPAAFLSKDDYSIKLNTLRRYKLRCEDEISAIAIGDIENVKAKETKRQMKTKCCMNLPRQKILL